MSDDYIDDQTARPIVDALRAWASAHPARTAPFLAIVPGDTETGMPRTLTPQEFLVEVERQSQIGLGFLRFILAQSERYHEPPEEFIYRALSADRTQAVGGEPA